MKNNNGINNTLLGNKRNTLLDFKIKDDPLKSYHDVADGRSTKTPARAIGGVMGALASFSSSPRPELCLYVSPPLAGGRCLTMPLQATGLLLCADVS